MHSYELLQVIWHKGFILEEVDKDAVAEEELAVAVERFGMPRVVERTVYVREDGEQPAAGLALDTIDLEVVLRRPARAGVVLRLPEWAVLASSSRPPPLERRGMAVSFCQLTKRISGRR